jgi:hypothetical protein
LRKTVGRNEKIEKERKRDKKGERKKEKNKEETRSFEQNSGILLLYCTDI